MKETNTYQSTRADSDKMLLREVYGWVHHAADLDRRSKVRTVELKRPIGLAWFAHKCVACRKIATRRAGGHTMATKSWV